MDSTMFQAYLVTCVITKFASARIPLPLSRHIAATFRRSTA